MIVISEAIGREVPKALNRGARATNALPGPAIRGGCAILARAFHSLPGHNRKSGMCVSSWFLRLELLQELVRICLGYQLYRNQNFLLYPLSREVVVGF